jgi:F0F1-type ATP synthase assembly protein I
MTEQSDSLTRRKRRDYFAGGLSLGIALGLLFGTALGNPPIGLVIGVAVGVALGVMMREAATTTDAFN